MTPFDPIWPPVWPRFTVDVKEVGVKFDVTVSILPFSMLFSTLPSLFFDVTSLQIFDLKSLSNLQFSMFPYSILPPSINIIVLFENNKRNNSDQSLWALLLSIECSLNWRAKLREKKEWVETERVCYLKQCEDRCVFLRCVKGWTRIFWFWLLSLWGWNCQKSVEILFSIKFEGQCKNIVNIHFLNAHLKIANTS